MGSNVSEASYEHGRMTRLINSLFYEEQEHEKYAYNDEG